MSEESKKRPHLFLNNEFSTQAEYTRPPKPIKFELPSQNRISHGNKLLGEIKSISQDMLSAVEIQKKSAIDLDYGIHIQIESFEGLERVFEDWSFKNTGIELDCIHHENNSTYATIFVPDGKLNYFEQLINDYLEEHRINGRLYDNHKKIDVIKNIRTATLRALWTDTLSEFPENGKTEIWWEVWLSARSDKHRSLSAFHTYTQSQGFIVSKNSIEFPQRTVFVLKATREKMESSLLFLNSVAELRKAKETAEFFTSLHPSDERDWIVDLLKRLKYPVNNSACPYICVLDTGINRANPLLEKSIDSSDLLTIDPNWGVTDKQGHGTRIAGAALFGDLKKALISSEQIELTHKLESVKILDNNGDNTGNEHFHASLTNQAVSRSVINNSQRIRIFQLAVTADDYRDKGKPSVWSSVIDMMAFNRDEKKKAPQLFVISGGNVSGPTSFVQYPRINEKEGIHDPGQAWNALTVGAYTEKTVITEPDTEDFKPIAKPGALSPFSSTSCGWDTQWPFKPDIVMEGGNIAQDSFGGFATSSLSVLTTHNIPAERFFTTINATSAASALASNLAAKVLNAYPEMNAVTLRGLLVHSASWTDTMKTEYLGNPHSKRKGDYINMVRHCGFGVPDPDVALWTVKNALTMVIEDSIQPFNTKSNSFREMRFYDLPWPKDALSKLGSNEVEMRVTLSYFIEPNPSSRGRSRYTYQSHGLRFDVNQPTEERKHFIGRVSAKYRDSETDYSRESASDYWCLGDARHRGSIHSDVWRGPAADLARTNIIGVFPIVGWWKKNTLIKRLNSVAHYSLLISLRAPDIDVDLLTPIENQITTTTAIQVGL